MLSWQEARQTQGSIPQRLLSAYGVTRPPVPLGEILFGLGIAYTEPLAPGWSVAAHLSGNDVPYIWVDVDLPPARKRVMTAHALGHLLLHPLEMLRTDVFHCKDVWTACSLYEAQANTFAQNLLNPQRWASL
jgi:hypothetical protein